MHSFWLAALLPLAVEAIPQASSDIGADATSTCCETTVVTLPTATVIGSSTYTVGADGASFLVSTESTTTTQTTCTETPTTASTTIYTTIYQTLSSGVLQPVTYTLTETIGGSPAPGTLPPGFTTTVIGVYTTLTVPIGPVESPTGSLTPGGPLPPATFTSPMASESQCSNVVSFITQTVTQTVPGDTTTVAVQTPIGSSASGIVTLTTETPGVADPSTTTLTPLNPGDTTTVVVESPSAGGMITATVGICGSLTISSIILPGVLGDPTTLLIGTPASGDSCTTLTPGPVTEATSITLTPATSGGTTTVVVETPASSSSSDLGFPGDPGSLILTGDSSTDSTSSAPTSSAPTSSTPTTPGGTFTPSASTPGAASSSPAMFTGAASHHIAARGWTDWPTILLGPLLLLL